MATKTSKKKAPVPASTPVLKPTPKKDTGFDMEYFINELWNNMPHYLKEMFGIELWNRQIDVYEALKHNRWVSVRSGHSTGKSFLIAVLAIIYALTHSPSYVIILSSVHKQIKNVNFPEIRSLLNKMIGQFPALSTLYNGIDLMDVQIKFGDNDKHYIYGITSDEPSALAGFHNENLLVICDEASGIQNDCFDAILSLASGPCNKVLLMGNPIKPDGFFYDSHKPSSAWKKLHISSLETPNYKKKKTIIPGLAEYEWVEFIRKQEGEYSLFWQTRILGNFPSMDMLDQLINEKTLYECSISNVPDSIDKPSLAMGCDIARFGADSTVMLIRDKHQIIAIYEYKKQDTMLTADLIATHAKEYGIKDKNIYVDSVGIGGGPIDRLKQLGLYNVQEVNFGAKAKNEIHYYNKRAECYDLMAKDISNLHIPRHLYEKFIRELPWINREYHTNGKMRIMDKQALKSIIGKSPDYSDALAITYANPTSNTHAILSMFNYGR